MRRFGRVIFTTVILGVFILVGAPSSPTLHAQSILEEMQARADAGQKSWQLELAKAYLRGDIVPRDRVMAYFWFNLVVANAGNSAGDGLRSDQARAERDKLDKLLTSDQIGQAESMSREWKPKEVLESESLRGEFQKAFFLVVADKDDPEYGYFRGKPLPDIDSYFHRWETRDWFTGFLGASSKPCQVEVHDSQTPAERELFGTSYSRLDCRLSQSSDETRARSTFESVARYLWDLVPEGWMREPDQPKLPHPALLELDLYSDRAAGQHLPELKGTEIQLLLYDSAGPTYTLYLIFRQKSFCVFCSDSDRKSAAQGAYTGAAGAAGGTEPTAAKAIDEIQRSRFLPMPPAQGMASNGASGTTLAIKNNTAYSLTIYISGPVDRTISLPSGGNQEVTLARGQYRMAAKVANPGILPFYGEQAFDVGRYSETFYISAQ